MTAGLSLKLKWLAIALTAATTGFVAPAPADDGCSSPYVWGRDSYFGDRWEYSYRHAYPEGTYRSSRHFIYYRRTPHFYSSFRSPNSNYYCSPEFQAYYTVGPYVEPTHYIEAREYTSPMTRPYVPSCNGEAGESHNEMESVNQPAPVDDPPSKEDLYLSKAGREILDRGWDLLRDGKAKDAMPILAEAAMMRSADALPRLAYGLAAAMDDQDTVAAWAIRKAIGMDSDVLLNVPRDGALRQQLADAMNARRSAGEPTSNDDADALRNAQVVDALLAVLAHDAEAMKTSLTRLAETGDKNMTKSLAVASRTYIAQRWTDSASPGEALASTQK